MGETYSCTDCDKVFSRAYELKKHKATHDDPDSVFYCSECSFITLQKKNLAIHFAIHTGEKIHGCPDTISFVSSSGSPAREERCDYRTNDPAALSRHRKKVHGYIPPPNRSRLAKAAPVKPRKPRQQKDGKVTRRRKANGSSSGAGYTSIAVESPENSTPLPRLGDMDGAAMDVDCYEEPGYGSATLVASDEEMGLDTFYDSSLRSQWMAKYEEGYNTFDMTGTRHLPAPLPAVPPSAPAGFDMQTGREGCLCPEWMVEAGIEGWDQSVFETLQ